VFKKIQKEPATCSQARRPPFGAEGETWVLGGASNGTAFWLLWTESLSLDLSKSTTVASFVGLVEQLTPLVWKSQLSDLHGM